jgi:integrase/recombinase XerD
MHLNHVKTYENYLATEKGRQASTITAYSRDVKRFETWISENIVNPVDWGMVSTQHIRAYMADNPEIGPRRFHRVVSSLRSWFEYLNRIAQVIASNPAATVGKPKLPKRLAKYLRADDMQKLLQSCAKNSRVNEQFRDVNLVAFLYGTGLRISEALGLKLEDIRYKTEADGFQTPVSIRVIGKGDKERMVPLSDTGQRALFQWLRRRKLEGGSTPFVWVQLSGTARGKLLTDRGVRRMVNARSIDAGLGPRERVDRGGREHRQGSGYRRAWRCANHSRLLESNTRTTRECCEKFAGRAGCDANDLKLPVKFSRI